MKVFVAMLRLLCGAADGQTLLCCSAWLSVGLTSYGKQLFGLWGHNSVAVNSPSEPAAVTLHPGCSGSQVGQRGSAGGQRRWRHASSAGCEPNWERRQCMKVMCTQKQVAAHRPRREAKRRRCCFKGRVPHFGKCSTFNLLLQCL